MPASHRPARLRKYALPREAKSEPTDFGDVCLSSTRQRQIAGYVAMAAVLALLSITGCAQVGKGKAPPPVVTKG